MGRNYVGKENKTGRTQRQVHGEKKGGETPMDVEAKAVGGKQKERIPLEEIPADEEFGKKQKMEGEVMALGKIMAQHLGPVLAAG